MARKAVELSLNTVIVAAIVLLVLIVLVIIFTGQSGKFTRGLNDCKARGGGTDESNNGCTDTNQQCIDNGGVPSGDCIFYDSDGKIVQSLKNKVCCVIKK